MRFFRQADKNYKIMNYNCNIYEPANEASILKEAKEVSNRKWLLLQFKMMNNELLMNVAVSADYWTAKRTVSANETYLRSEGFSTRPPVADA